MIRVETDPRGVRTVALDRPDVRNAFNVELIAAITSAVHGLGEDTRVLVLRGEGKVFCAGADLNWMRSMAAYTREENVADSTRLRQMFEAIESCPVPVVARVHGACMAGATGLVACSDVAVAEQGCVFAFTETRLGLVPAVISPWVVRKVGYSFARAFFLSAERFDADRAYEAGLVHYVVPSDELDAKVDEIVDGFLKCGPRALRETRKLLDEVHGHRPDEVREITVRAIADARVSDEGQEGVAAFFDKRPPGWVSPKA
jgi:methylglutaconyl-CoA hydratase